MMFNKNRFGIGSLILGIFGAFVLFGPRQVGPQQDNSLRYDTPGTSLHGIVTQRNVYGPPGYGETPSRDSRMKTFVLKIPNSISVEPAPNAEANGSVNLDSAKDVREIQLFVPKSQTSSIQKLIGHAVTVKGTLNESITASQYTKVWLDVATFQ